jgi:hypothetical protein
MDVSFRSYLGDAVYADYDGYHLVLTTEDGISTTNRICLEPSVYEALTHYVIRLRKRNDKLRKEQAECQQRN